MRTLLFILATSIAAAQTSPGAYSPITQAQRLKWATIASVGPANLAGGVVTSAFGTWSNSPPEYGPHWEGYFKRQGLRLTGALPSNFAEAELGVLLDEDPRYRRATEKGVKKRIWHAVKSSFIAYNHNGKAVPAYAFFIANPATNALANTWRPDSQRTVGNTMSRITFGFTGRMASNAFAEFWPDISRKLFKK